MTQRAASNFLNLIISLLCGLTFMPSVAKAAKNSVKKQMIVTGIESDSNVESSYLTITMSEKVSAEKISTRDLGSFIEIEIKGAQAAKPGTFIDSEGPWFKKAAIFQVNDSTAAVRVFTDEASAIRQVSKIDLLENRVVFSLNHKALSSFLNASAKAGPKLNPDGSLTVDKKIAADQSSSTNQMAPMSNSQSTAGDTQAVLGVSGDNTAPQGTEAQTSGLPAGIGLSSKSALDAKEKVEALSGEGLGNASKADFATKMRNASLMIACLILLAGAMFYLRGNLKHRRAAAQGEEVLTMKRLSTMALNAKQQLSLIEVGGEKLLLAVSNDQVSLITHINKSDDRIRLSESRRDPELPASQRKALPPVNSGTIPPLGPLGKTIFDKNASEKNSFDKALEGDQGPVRPSSKGSKINLQVDDAGVKKNPEDAIKDVTSIIRQKMKDLPKF